VKYKGMALIVAALSTQAFTVAHAAQPVRPVTALQAPVQAVAPVSALRRGARQEGNQLEGGSWALALAAAAAVVAGVVVAADGGDGSESP